MCSKMPVKDSMTLLKSNLSLVQSIFKRYHGDRGAWVPERDRMNRSPRDKRRSLFPHRVGRTLNLKHTL